ncbi:hypothetical protein BDV3_005459 [Batrachochytrium dendrobatidis]
MMTKEQTADPVEQSATDSPVKKAIFMEHPAAAAEETASDELKGLSVNDIPTLLAAGAQAYAMSNFSLAAEKLSIASQLQTEMYGQKSRESAEILFHYGRALLANAVQKNSLLGENVGEAGAASFSESVATGSTPGKAGHFVFNGDEENSEDDDECAEEQVERADVDENGGDDGVALGDIDEEDPEDLEIAWETFDLVRIIYTESEVPEDKKKLGEVYMALGDVSLESGNFEQAITDFLTALRIKEETLDSDDRELAEAHYKLALALEYSEQIEDAIVQVTQTTTVLEKHLHKLTNRDAVTENGDGADIKGKKAADPVPEAVSKEIKEVESLLAEMSAKMFDLGAALEKEQDGETIGNELKTEKSKTSVNTTDVSGLVKKTAKVADTNKRAISDAETTAETATESSNEDHASKKPKV